MRRKLSGIIARVALFTTVCLVFTFALIAVFGQLRFEDRTGYNAVFTNISGLKSGNFVRIAGVEVGKVGDLTLHRDRHCQVEQSDQDLRRCVLVNPQVICDA